MNLYEALIDDVAHDRIELRKAAVIQRSGDSIARLRCFLQRQEFLQLQRRTLEASGSVPPEHAGMLASA